MAALSDAQLWTLCVSQWGNSHDAQIAFCVALAESSGNPTATHKNTNGTTDYGLFQINSVHADLLKGQNWQDPAANAHMAYVLWDAAKKSFSPWTTFKVGAYMFFMPRAQAAQQANPNAQGPTGQSGSSGADSTGNSTTDPAIATATSGDTWSRIGYFLSGALLMLIVAVSLIKNTSVGKSVAHIAKTATKVAAVA